MIKRIFCVILILFFIISTVVYSNEQPKLNKNNKEILENLLNEDNILWKTDSDNDGITDALEEIIGSNKYKKDSDEDGLNDKLEIELNLNPNKKDSDNNGVEDKDEDFDNDGIGNEYELKYRTNPKINDKFITPEFRSKNVKVNGKMLLESCKLSYEGIEKMKVGKTVKDVFGKKYNLLSDFTIIRTTGNTKGFSAIALKNGDALIIAYQASKDYKDWLGNFLTQFMPHPQRSACIEFLNPIINKEDKIYITGHSLGGLLTQYAIYELYNNDYKNIKGITFNSANNMNPNHIKGEYGPLILKKSLVGYYISAYADILSETDEKIKDKKELIEFFDKSIEANGFIDINNKKWKDSDFFRDYDKFIENYIVKGDPLYSIINGGYLGKYNIKDCGYENKEIIQNEVDFSNAHRIENFENDINLRKVIEIN
ncbi:alpha/beta hydrolase [Romboutsia sp. 1001713B170131_170501_G6]|uniref:alpha/beta hydrolase n=1 Tax=Romboutsia sp. 1001713B170131_170501_G6 TaxID=2787108 RepID=UPI0018ABD4D3|nr:Mbeg1-like protein [Romboutsia sp. 1001713B170131_170501_G6]